MKSMKAVAELLQWGYFQNNNSNNNKVWYTMHVMYKKKQVRKKCV